MNIPSPPAATKTNRMFRMEYAITNNIRASRERIWAVLSNADEFPRWNSTVTSLKGTIALGEQLELKVPLAPKRVFKPKVSKFEPNRTMEWSDGMAPMFKGVRTFTLSENPDGSTEFSMSEVFAGLMLPLIKGSLPDFGPAFETYASDLKREAERSA